MLATFFKGFFGKSCPLVDPIVIPGLSVLVTFIRSPIGSKQKPRTSNPHEILATLPGQNTSI